jgi:hypothetical protein
MRTFTLGTSTDEEGMPVPGSVYAPGLGGKALSARDPERVQGGEEFAAALFAIALDGWALSEMMGRSRVPPARGFSLGAWEGGAGVELAEAKDRLKAIEKALAAAPFVEFHVFERDGRALHVGLTERLRKHARKEGVWKSREMLASLKNAAYGFQESQARSVGGRDGIFLLDRSYHPANEMMHKLFDRFLDKPDSGAEELAAALGTTVAELLPVRLVSHHLRLLGVLARGTEEDWLVLVDCDRSE